MDQFPLNHTIFSENSIFGYGDGKDDGNITGFENQPFDIVYSTPPPSPEKGLKVDTHGEVNNVQLINFGSNFMSKNENGDKNDMQMNNCQITINPYIPLNSMPVRSMVPNDPFISTGILNNGSIYLPSTSIIAVDPIVYMQLLNSYRTNNLFSDLYPQLYSQYCRQLFGNSNVNEQVTQNNNTQTVSETPNPKKRKSTSNKKPQRRVRPKVVPEKGAIQCIGMNRKKNQRCRNAALMEYIGPRPKYCAEHIHLDPECLYMKCGSSYQKVPGDKKGCREVVLKEFGLCHKHYRDSTEKMLGEEGLKLAQGKLERVNSLLNTLESEAMKAKKTNADLYQRKNKLLPKFQDMKNILLEQISKLKLEGLGEETN
jgi:hypothetical protein